MAEHTVFTLSEVAQHKSKKDCWLVIDGRVLNVTRFLEEHPGGEEVLLESSGKDATKDFKDIGHSKTAQNLLFKYQVGILQGYTLKKDADVQVASTDEPKNKKEMSAFVIKDDSMPKYAALAEFFVPLLVAVCSNCNGSRKVYAEKEGDELCMKCPDCNENGLVKCFVCY